MNFASDNAAGVAPAILETLGQVNTGHMLGYGNDAVTGRLADIFNTLFEREVAAYLVPTGTACNALALAHLSPPWGSVLCHDNAHIVTSEAGAPEFFGGGLKLIELPGAGGKITADILQAKLEGAEWGGPHHVTPSVLSLTQVTEAGTMYRTEEIEQLARIAHDRKIAVHMDGARFGNAVAALNASPAQASWKAGVDVLSFGATKGGAMAAEAIIFFDKAKAEGMGERHVLCASNDNSAETYSHYARRDPGAYGDLLRYHRRRSGPLCRNCGREIISPSIAQFGPCYRPLPGN